MFVIANNFFYCYDKQMMLFLKNKKGFAFNCTGFNTKTMDQFWQFTSSEELRKATKEFVTMKMHQQSN